MFKNSNALPVTGADMPTNKDMFTGQWSGLLAPMYRCPQHGEVWRVETVEIIDTVNDDVYIQTLCAVCHDTVSPMSTEGIPVLHPLTDEEAYWEQMSVDDPDDEA